MATVEFSIGNIWLQFDMHVVEAPIQMLICVNDMDKNGIYFNNLTNVLIHYASGCRATILRKE